MSLIFMAGVAVPVAVALNTALARGLKNPLMSALIVPSVGVLFMLAVLILWRNPTPTVADFANLPWYVWTGGILIALYMIILIFNVPIVGIGLSTSLVVAGQLFAGAFIDHFGLFGLPQVSFNFGRFLGIIVVLTGVALLKIF